MPREPQSEYAKGPGGRSIAFQVVGEGPLDLVVFPGWLSHVDLLWRDPGWERFVDLLSEFARVILFDPAGIGLSDPSDGPPTLESRVDDLRAVLDAAGSSRTALFGYSMGGPPSVMFAAACPERTTALILYGTYANASIDDDGSPGRGKWIATMKEIRESIDHWGEGRTIDWAAPSLSHSSLYRRATGALERAGMSPSTALAAWHTHLTELDVSAILDSVRVPTLVLHRRDDAIPVEFARELAERIPDAQLVELEGADHHPAVGDTESITGEVEEFLTGTRHASSPSRVLATVLFTDIVGSTERASELGDRAWRELLERHDQVARAQIARFGGVEVKQTGDGFLATFDGPTRALRCAMAFGEQMERLGLQVRGGVHTGECERRGQDVGGIAVHIGARIGGLAAPGEVLVSSTVKELAAGSGIAFEDRGMHPLKGIPDQWRLFSAAAGDRRLEQLESPPDPKPDRIADRLVRMPRVGRAVMRTVRRA